MRKFFPGAVQSECRLITAPGSLCRSWEGQTHLLSHWNDRSSKQVKDSWWSSGWVIKHTARGDPQCFHKGGYVTQDSLGNSPTGDTEAHKDGFRLKKWLMGYRSLKCTMWHHRLLKGNEPSKYLCSRILFYLMEVKPDAVQNLNWLDGER